VTLHHFSSRNLILISRLSKTNKMGKLGKRLPLSSIKYVIIFLFIYTKLSAWLAKNRVAKATWKNAYIVKIIMPRPKFSELKKSKLLCDSNYLLIKNLFLFLLEMYCMYGTYLNAGSMPSLCIPPPPSPPPPHLNCTARLWMSSF
jgi:hypothetical protein